MPELSVSYSNAIPPFALTLSPMFFFYTGPIRRPFFTQPNPVLFFDLIRYVFVGLVDRFFVSLQADISRYGRIVIFITICDSRLLLNYSHPRMKDIWKYFREEICTTLNYRLNYVPLGLLRFWMDVSAIDWWNNSPRSSIKIPFFATHRLTTNS